MENAPAVAAVQKSPLIVFSTEQMDVIRRQFFTPDALEADVNYCFSVAQTLGLNPLTKQIQFVPRKAQLNGKWVDKTEPMVGRDGLLAVAHRSGLLEALESSVTIGQYPQMDAAGNWKMAETLVATAKVYRKGYERPFVVEVAFNEYAQKTSEGKFTKFWNTMPTTMLKKVAESQALRKAFNIEGVVTAEEAGIGYTDDSGNLVRDPEVVQGEVVEAELGKPDAPAVNAAEETVEPVVVQADQAGTTGADIPAEEGTPAASADAAEIPLSEEDKSFLAAHPEPVADPLITTAQAHEINQRITDYKADYGKFLEYMGVTSIADIPQSKYGTAIVALEEKRRKNEERAQQQPTGSPVDAPVETGPEQPSLLAGGADKMQQVILAVMAKSLSPQIDEQQGIVVVKLAFNDATNKEYLKSLGFKYDGTLKSWKWSA